MKLKDITDWSERWLTPLGTMVANASVADGVLVDLSLWGTSIINLTVQCPMENISAQSEHRGMCTSRLFRCLVPLHLPQATLQISVFRPVPITPRQLFSDIMRAIHFTLCEDQLANVDTRGSNAHA